MKNLLKTILAVFVLVCVIVSVNTVLFASSVIVVNSSTSFNKDSGEVICQGYGRMSPSVSSYLRYDADIDSAEVKKLLIKDGITILDSYALMGAFKSNDWVNLTEITLPKSIKKIQGDFSRCPSLKIINYAGTAEEWNEIIIRDNQDELFSKLEFNYSIDVPKSDESLADNAGNEIEVIEIEPDKQIVCTFNYITDKLVVSGNGPLYISENEYDSHYSVYNLFCSGDDEDNLKIPYIRDIVIENGITKLCEYNFDSVYNSVFIPKSVTEIEANCFGSLDNDVWYQKAVDHYREADNKKMDVYYEGTIEDWNAIKIGDMNDELVKGNIHYASTNKMSEESSSKGVFVAGVSVAAAMMGAAGIYAVIKKKKK